LQGDEDTDAKIVTPKMNAGAVAGKAAAPNRNANGQFQRLEPSSSMPMLPAS